MKYYRKVRFSLKKRIGKYPHTFRFETVKNNQFINLTHYKDMRKISLKGYLCLKSLAFKQILPTIKITLFLLLFIIFQVYSENNYSQCTMLTFLVII